MFWRVKINQNNIQSKLYLNGLSKCIRNSIQILIKYSNTFVRINFSSAKQNWCTNRVKIWRWKQWSQIIGWMDEWILSINFNPCDLAAGDRKIKVFFMHFFLHKRNLVGRGPSRRIKRDRGTEKFLKYYDKFKQIKSLLT